MVVMLRMLFTMKNAKFFATNYKVHIMCPLNGDLYNGLKCSLKHRHPSNILMTVKRFFLHHSTWADLFR